MLIISDCSLCCQIVVRSKGGAHQRKQTFYCIGRVVVSIILYKVCFPLWYLLLLFQVGSREQLIRTCFLSEFPELPSEVKPVTNIPVSKYGTILKETGHSNNCWGFYHVLNSIVNTLWIKGRIWGSYKFVLNEWTLGKEAKQKSLI